MRQTPDDGLKIFTDDCMLEPEYALPRERVLEFLERIDSDLVLQYLDYCIFNWSETSTKFHDTLINKYRERIRTLMAEYQLQMHQQRNANTIEILDDENDITSDNNHTAREYILKLEPAGQEPGELGQLRRKLMSLLEDSDHYTTETLPTYLLHDGLFDERAIVMGKTGNHREALIIYVHILNDLQRAEEYCLRQYYKPTDSHRTTENNRNVFLLLFEQCLKTQVEHKSIDNKHYQRAISQNRSIIEKLEPNIQIAIGILARHSTRINLLRAIELLPATLPLCALNTILLCSMQHITSNKNSLQILQQLLHAQRLRVNKVRIEMEQATVTLVTSNDICKVCMKRIGKR